MHFGESRGQTGFPNSVYFYVIITKNSYPIVNDSVNCAAAAD